MSTDLLGSTDYTEDEIGKLRMTYCGIFNTVLDCNTFCLLFKHSELTYKLSFSHVKNDFDDFICL